MAKKKTEQEIITLTKLQVAWQQCYECEEWKLCDAISARIGEINGVKRLDD